MFNHHLFMARLILMGVRCQVSKLLVSQNATHCFARPRACMFNALFGLPSFYLALFVGDQSLVATAWLRLVSDAVQDGLVQPVSVSAVFPPDSWQSVHGRQAPSTFVPVSLPALGQAAAMFPCRTATDVAGCIEA